MTTMKKKIFNFALMAALACGLSMSVTSCKDDDNNDSNGNGGNDTADTEVMNDEHTDEAIMAWRWVNVMTDDETADDSWQDQTHVVTIGTAGATAVERVIYVSDLDEAKIKFSTIAGCTPDYLSTDRHFDAGEFGTMDWQISGDGATNIATVAVDSKLFGSFSKLTFCNESQAADNAEDITGNCYYRLGDIIEDSEGYYWVCVQPSFLGKKNNQSYWINIFNAAESGKATNGQIPGIPNQNIKSTWNKKYNGNTILLPTGLKMNREQNYNLANLIWALLNPAEYKKMVGTEGKGLCGFDYKYHGENYVSRVSKYWDTEGIWKKLFNRSQSQMEKMEELYFFYNGYHWKVGSTAGVWIYQSKGYQTEYTGSDDDDDMLFEMKAPGFGFDIRRYASDPKQDSTCCAGTEAKMAPYTQFTGTQGFWVIRVATGKQLDKNYKPYNKMANVRDIYRFNDKADQGVGNQKPLATDNVIGMNGYFVTGDVIMDESNNHKWICVAGWLDREIGKSWERKAHFISFDGLPLSEQIIANTGGQKGTLADCDDLLPEEMAPTVLNFLFNPCTTNDKNNNDVAYNFYSAAVSCANVDLKRFILTRDTILSTGETTHIRSINVLYRPKGGLTSGTQPYMRAVWDGTTVGANRSDNTANAYWFRHYYKKYNQPGGQLMDLTHLWEKSPFLENNPVKADKWSRCKRTGTEQRDGDFTAADRYTGEFTWLNWHRFNPQWMSAYREPVLALRYMALTDESKEFQGEYDGKQFKLLSSVPEKFREASTIALIGLFSPLHYDPKHPYAYMDGEPFNENPLLKESTGWK